MRIPSADTVSPEVQRARCLLAELCERGERLLTRDRHLQVLLAFDALERGGVDFWPPPPLAIGIADAEAALTEVGELLTVIAVDTVTHRALGLLVGLARQYVLQAISDNP